MRFLDRLLTIVVTVTLTSAAWILFGTFYLDDRETTEEVSSTSDPRSPGEGARANSNREGAVPRVPTHMAANDFVVPVAGVLKTGTGLTRSTILAPEVTDTGPLPFWSSAVRVQR